MSVQKEGEGALCVEERSSWLFLSSFVCRCWTGEESAFKIALIKRINQHKCWSESNGMKTAVHKQFCLANHLNTIIYIYIYIFSMINGICQVGLLTHSTIIATLRRNRMVHDFSIISEQPPPPKSLSEISITSGMKAWFKWLSFVQKENKHNVERNKITARVPSQSLKIILFCSF
jgi:hypothetical protein